MHRKELMLRTGAFVLSASLAMSSPIAVFAEGNTDTAPTVSVSSGDTDNSEPDGAMTATPSDAAPDQSSEEDIADEVVPEESLPEDETSDDFISDEDVPEKDLMPDDSKQEEKEVTEGDVKQKFTITVRDHFADSVETRETATLEKDSEYSYSALENREGWQVVGDSSYDGVLTEDLTLDFYYDSPSLYNVFDPNTGIVTYKIKVYDCYPSGENAVREIECNGDEDFVIEPEYKDSYTVFKVIGLDSSCSIQDGKIVRTAKYDFEIYIDYSEQAMFTITDNFYSYDGNTLIETRTRVVPYPIDNGDGTYSTVTIEPLSGADIDGYAADYGSRPYTYNYGQTNKFTYFYYAVADESVLQVIDVYDGVEVPRTVYDDYMVQYDDVYVNLKAQYNGVNYLNSNAMYNDSDYGYLKTTSVGYSYSHYRELNSAAGNVLRIIYEKEDSLNLKDIDFMYNIDGVEVPADSSIIELTSSSASTSGALRRYKIDKQVIPYNGKKYCIDRVEYLDKFGDYTKLSGKGYGGDAPNETVLQDIGFELRA